MGASKVLHVVAGERDLEVDLGECRIKHSNLIKEIVTLTCGRGDNLILAVLKLIEAGIPATSLAAYPCGPSGPLGEIAMYAPKPCSKLPLNGAVKIYCGSSDVCALLGGTFVGSIASRLRFTKLKDAWVLEFIAEKESSIDLGLIERVNKEELRAVMVSPIRVPPLYINLPDIH